MNVQIASQFILYCFVMCVSKSQTFFRKQLSDVQHRLVRKRQWAQPNEGCGVATKRDCCYLTGVV